MQVLERLRGLKDRLEREIADALARDVYDVELATMRDVIDDTIRYFEAHPEEA